MVIRIHLKLQGKKILANNLMSSWINQLLSVMENTNLWRRIHTFSFGCRWLKVKETSDISCFLSESLCFSSGISHPVEKRGDDPSSTRYPGEELTYVVSVLICVVRASRSWSGKIRTMTVCSHKVRVCRPSNGATADSHHLKLTGSASGQLC